MTGDVVLSAGLPAGLPAGPATGTAVNRGDWLVNQLPGGLLAEDFFVRFVRIFQAQAETLLSHADNVVPPRRPAPRPARDGAVHGRVARVARGRRVVPGAHAARGAAHRCRNTALARDARRPAPAPRAVLGGAGVGERGRRRLGRGPGARRPRVGPAPGRVDGAARDPTSWRSCWTRCPRTCGWRSSSAGRACGRPLQAGSRVASRAGYRAAGPGRARKRVQGHDGAEDWVCAWIDDGADRGAHRTVRGPGDVPGVRHGVAP